MTSNAGCKVNGNIWHGNLTDKWVGEGEGSSAFPHAEGAGLAENCLHKWKQHNSCGIFFFVKKIGSYFQNIRLLIEPTEQQLCKNTSSKFLSHSCSQCEPVFQFFYSKCMLFSKCMLLFHLFKMQCFTVLDGCWFLRTFMPPKTVVHTCMVPKKACSLSANQVSAISSQQGPIRAENLI